MAHTQIGFAGIGIPLGSTPVLIRSPSGDYTLIDDDFFGSRYIRMNSATPQKVIVPTGITLEQPCTIIQAGAGACSFEASPGVTLQSVDGWLSFRTRYSSITIVRIGTNSFDLIGDLAN